MAVVASLIAEFTHVDLQRCNLASREFAQAVLPQRAVKVSRRSAVENRQQRGFLSHPADPLIR
jgi:hypothetical protein